MLNFSNWAAARAARCAVSAVLLTGALVTTAAAEDAKIKSALFSIQPVYQGDEIVVTSSDGKKWDTIDAKALKLSATMKVDTKHPGYVSQVGILLGGCHNTGCANNPVMYYAGVSSRDYNKNKVFTFPGNKIPVSTTGIAVPSFGDEIIKSCNSKLQSDGATQTHAFSKLLTASFSANTRKAAGSLPPAEVEGPASEYPDYNGGDVTRQAKFAVKVTCKAHELKVSQVDFHVTVSGKDFAEPQGCPATGRVRVNILTNRAGKVTFKLYRDDGANQTVVAEGEPVVNDASGTSHVVKWEKTYNLTKSVDRKYMVVLIGHKFSTPWKPMVLKCGVQNDSAGPGDVSTRPDPTHGKPTGGKATDNPSRQPVIVTPKPPRRPAKPAIKVAPLPKVVCIDGKIAGSGCFCPARTKKVQIGPNAYRCVVNVVKPKRSVPKASGVMSAPRDRLLRVRRSSALSR